jgi:hypothetical protein
MAENIRGTPYYYSRGCSDLFLDVGRTLLARNRCEAALLLEQRVSRCSRAEAARRVGKRIENGLRFGYNAHEYAAILTKARERMGVNASYGSYEWLVRECADSVYDEEASHCTNALLDQSTNYSRLRAPPRRAYALADAAAHPALDEINTHALRRLVGTPLALDTLQLIEQPAFKSIVWAVELWDVRLLQADEIRRRRVPPGDYALSAAISTRHLSRADGSPCAPWKGFDTCWACNGSELAASCHVRNKCTPAATLAAYRAHVRVPALVHADVLDV